MGTTTSAKLKVISSPAKMSTNGKTPAPGRRPNYARWRALSLSLVYLVFAAHIIHWKITGKTLAPLELNEVMYTLELGIITAGFIFMCALVLGTLLFGRFFCSWACHIMVLQDACAWMLGKIGIRAKPLRSRLLLFVPPLTAFYMFVWPQIVRAWSSEAIPTFHWATDKDGWASLVTENFWRNLPGPWVIAITFIVCGFLMVYLLGSRTFCTYVCPYGAVFGLADRFSPGRIKVSDACEQCGKCTAACSSGIRVHEEVHMHGMIVNPACLKDFDCISACPQEALSYGLGRPALLKSLKSGGRFGVGYDFTLLEEMIASVVFVVSVLCFRSLYATVPFLLSLAMGVLLGFLTVQAIRLVTRPQVRVGAFSLKHRGRIGASGAGFTVVFAALVGFTGHSGYVRYHEFFGLRGATAFGGLNGDSRTECAEVAYGRLKVAERYGLVRNHNVQRALALTSFQLGYFGETIEKSRRIIADAPDDVTVQIAVARSLNQLGRVSEATTALEWIATRYEGVPSLVGSVVSAHSELAMIAGKGGDFEKSLVHLGEAVVLAPDRAPLHARYGESLAEVGRFDEAISQLSQAVALDPDLGRAGYNLGTILMLRGDLAGAVTHFENALAVMGDDIDLLNNLGSALLGVGRVRDARDHLERALVVWPTSADAHFNLARVFLDLGDQSGAHEHLQRASDLDARYTEFLEP